MHQGRYVRNKMSEEFRMDNTRLGLFPNLHPRNKE